MRGDADMAERPTIENLQADAVRREADYAARKRARVADASPANAVGMPPAVQGFACTDPAGMRSTCSAEHIQSLSPVAEQSPAATSFGCGERYDSVRFLAGSCPSLYSQHPHERASCGADSSRRAFYREFVKVVDASDVIIEVLDARDPAAYRSPDVERYVRAAGSNKKVILLLNKIGVHSFCWPRHG